MKLKKYFLGFLMVAGFAISAEAGAGKEAILKATSHSGKVRLMIKTWDVDGPVSGAYLVIDKDSFDLAGDYEIYSVIDLPNHILTLFFQQKGTTSQTVDAKTIKVWSIPNSFVKTTAGSEYNWRFKVRIDASFLKETTIMEGTFEWNP